MNEVTETTHGPSSTTSKSPLSLLPRSSVTYRITVGDIYRPTVRPTVRSWVVVSSHLLAPTSVRLSSARGFSWVITVDGRHWRLQRGGTVGRLFVTCPFSSVSTNSLKDLLTRTIEITTVGLKRIHLRNQARCCFEVRTRSLKVWMVQHLEMEVNRQSLGRVWSV